MFPRKPTTSATKAVMSANVSWPSRRQQLLPTTHPTVTFDSDEDEQKDTQQPSSHGNDGHRRLGSRGLASACSKRKWVGTKLDAVTSSATWMHEGKDHAPVQKAASRGRPLRRSAFVQDDFQDEFGLNPSYSYSLPVINLQTVGLLIWTHHCVAIVHVAFVFCYCRLLVWKMSYMAYTRHCLLTTIVGKKMCLLRVCSSSMDYQLDLKIINLLWGENCVPSWIGSPLLTVRNWTAFGACVVTCCFSVMRHQKECEKSWLN